MTQVCACASKCRRTCYTHTSLGSLLLFPHLLRLNALGLKLVHVTQETLKQFTSLRSNSLFELIHNLFWRQCLIKHRGIIRIPLDYLRQGHEPAEVGLWVFLPQHRKNFLSMGAPILFQIGKEPDR